jgi:hypothetical protein
MCVGLGVGSTPASAETTRHQIPFSNVVDITDFGADPTGTVSSSDAIERAVRPNTLVTFPSGTYLFDRPVNLWNGTVGFYGEGDVTFRPVEGYNNQFFAGRIESFLFENIDFDIRAKNTVTGFALRVDVRMVVTDVEFIGRGTHSDWSVTNAFSVVLRQPTTVGVIRRVTAKKGSAIGKYKGGEGRVGVFCGPTSYGTLRIEECHFEEFGNNGLYCSRTPGNVQVVDSYFRNNNVASVRLSGSGSYMKRTTIVIDMEAYTGPTGGTNRTFNTRCVWMEQAQGRFDFPAGMLIEDCTLHVKDAWKSAGAIVLQGYAKSLDIRDTLIQVDTDKVRAISRLAPKRENAAVRLQNVSITGAAEGGQSIFLEGADGSRISNSCLYTPGANRDGLRIKETADCVIMDTNISTGGQAIVEENSIVTQSGITNRDSCPSLQNDILAVRSVGEKRKCTYAFEVDGAVYPDRKVEANDVINGSTVTGVVAGGGADYFQIDGELTSFSVTNGSPQDVEFVLNERTLAPPVETHTVLVKSTGSEQYVRYTFSVSGTVEKGDTAERGDEIDGQTVSGVVGGGYVDSFNITGDITEFRVEDAAYDDVDVYLDGVLTEWATAPRKKTLIVKSIGTQASTEYEVTVSGDVWKTADVEGNDTVTGSTITGVVGGGGADTYQFTGQVTDTLVRSGSPTDIIVFWNDSP